MGGERCIILRRATPKARLVEGREGGLVPAAPLVQARSVVGERGIALLASGPYSLALLRRSGLIDLMELTRYYIIVD